MTVLVAATDQVLMEGAAMCPRQPPEREPVQARRRLWVYAGRRDVSYSTGCSNTTAARARSSQAGQQCPEKISGTGCVLSETLRYPLWVVI